MRIPEGTEWWPIAGRWEPGEDGWTAQPHDREGRPAENGRCELLALLPSGGCREVSVAFDLAMAQPNLELTLERAGWLVTAREISRVEDGVAEAFAPSPLATGRRHRLEVRANPGEHVLRVDGREVFRHTPRNGDPAIACLRWLAWGPARLENLSVEGRDFVGRPSVAPRDGFQLGCAVDFLDDARHCRFTPEMIGEYLRLLKEMGVRRVYWEDYMRHPRPEVAADPACRELMRRDLEREKPGVWETFSQGWDDFTVAVEQGHRLGLEMHALIKPFDWHFYDPSEERANYYPSMQFLYRNQDKIMARRPRPAHFAPEDAPIGTLRLVGMDDAPLGFPLGALELWASDDNRTYRPLSPQPRASEAVEERRFRDWWTDREESPRKVRVVTLRGLDLRAPHLAIHVPSEGHTLRNRLHRLVEIEATDGRPLEFTFGLVPKDGPKQGPVEVEKSFDWDNHPGVPSARRGGREVIEHFRAIDGDGQWLGVTRGALRAPRRNWIALSPSYAEVRTDWFLRLVRHALDAGADGIDLRAPDAHQRTHSWALQNFNPPMVGAYRERHGVDPSTQPWDRAEFCRLGGEFYGLFVKEASRLVRARGKRILHHVYREWDLPAEGRWGMNLRCDWVRWIEEGWLDGITLKEILPGTRFFHRVMDVAGAGGIEAHACMFLNTVLPPIHRVEIAPSGPRVTWRECLGALLRHARQGGCRGLILYEGCAFLRVRQGRVECPLPGMADLLREGLRGTA
jgi:hypothetical protein